MGSTFAAPRAGTYAIHLTPVGTLPKRNQLLRVAHGQRLDHQGIDERKDCGIRADPKGPRQKGNSRKSRALAQLRSA
jgi:hypothetical protein